MYSHNNLMKTTYLYCTNLQCILVHNNMLHFHDGTLLTSSLGYRDIDSNICAQNVHCHKLQKDSEWKSVAYVEQGRYGTRGVFISVHGTTQNMSIHLQKNWFIPWKFFIFHISNYEEGRPFNQLVDFQRAFSETTYKLSKFKTAKTSYNDYIQLTKNPMSQIIKENCLKTNGPGIPPTTEQLAQPSLQRPIFAELTTNTQNRYPFPTQQTPSTGPTSAPATQAAGKPPVHYKIFSSYSVMLTTI